ncbi:MAG: SUMF1/EgtB/PvdO family nonheme iron enzyme [Akkermansiaceae bacterium]|nr:SUMF1/EgtB/PvdO family nonheme iron enzyme [Akkermansiaceae bacterium]
MACAPFSAHPASASPTQKEVEPTAAELKEAEAAAAPISTGSLNIIPGELPDKASTFLPVTEKIFSTLKKVPEGDLKAYTETMSQSGDATIEMIPIPRGEFTIGSPEGQEGRSDDEGPQRKITIEPFWMASKKITWKLYQSFMENGKNRNKDGTLDLDGNKLNPEPPFASNPDLLDAYLPNYKQRPEGGVNPFALTPKRYSRVTPGDDWDCDPEDLRSGARLPSAQSWKNTDPQDPKSI